jgi:hypothetical protein
MHRLLVFSTLFLAVACDGPTRMRQGASVSGVDLSSNGGTTANAGTTNGGTTGATTGSTTGSTTGTTPAGFESCGAANIHSKANIGQVKICQNSGNELYFRLEYSSAASTQSDATCIVPMYKDSSNNSTYLGSAQCTIHTAGQVSYGYVSKNRAGYGHQPVNGVMVMKYSATTAFFQCMNGYATSYQPCAVACQQTYPFNSAPHQQCVSSCAVNATAYMNSMCSNFKASYPYIDVRLK